MKHNSIFHVDATKRDSQGFYAPLILSHSIPESRQQVGIVSTEVHNSFDVFPFLFL